MTHEKPIIEADEERLEDLQEDIDEVRGRLADPLHQGEHHFIDDGELDERLADDEEAVRTDDTIVPPG